MGSKSAEWGPNPLVDMDLGGPYLLSRFGPGSPYLLVDMDRGVKIYGGPNQLGHRLSGIVFRKLVSFDDLSASKYTNAYAIQRIIRLRKYVVETSMSKRCLNWLVTSKLCENWPEIYGVIITRNHSQTNSRWYRSWCNNVRRVILTRVCELNVLLVRG